LVVQSFLQSNLKLFCCDEREEMENCLYLHAERFNYK